MRPVLCLLAVLLLPACDTVSDAVDNAACQATGYADAGTVRATVAGDAFSGTCVRVDTEAGALTVVGADNVVSQNSQEVITLVLPSDSVRAYTLGASAATAAFAARAEVSGDQVDRTYLGVSGTVTVEAASATAARGTFSFTGRNAAGDEVAVTGGQFDVTF